MLKSNRSLSAGSTASVGVKAGVPICDDFSRTGKNAFTDKIIWAHIAVGDDSHDLFIDEEDRIRITMSLQ